MSQNLVSHPQHPELSGKPGTTMYLPKGHPSGLGGRDYYFPLRAQSNQDVPERTSAQHKE